MFIDTHMHIGYEFGLDPDEYVKKSLDNNVNILIASFCEKKDLNDADLFTKKYTCMYACIGYHPEIANDIVDNDLDILENMIKSNNKIIAIGEIGLDYHWDDSNKEKQKELFRKQLSLAERLNLPVIIHTRDAINDTYEILKEYKVKGIIHCFSGSLEMAKKFIGLGYLLGIGGVVTFKNSKLYQVIENIDLKNIVFETDSPYISPEPFRGKTNCSSNIPIIAEKVSEIKEIPLEKTAEITTKNAINFFDLDSKI